MNETRIIFCYSYYLSKAALTKWVFTLDLKEISVFSNFAVFFKDFLFHVREAYKLNAISACLVLILGMQRNFEPEDLSGLEGLHHGNRFFNLFWY